jgi:hypothetical protein
MTNVTPPPELYHGSSHHTAGALTPVFQQSTPDHVHTRPSVFATARKDLAALFMFPPDVLSSIGFEEDIAYICVWGTPREYVPNDKPGYLYILPPASFEKVGKEYEWQSFAPVTPMRIETYASALDGMMQCGVQVYFINDNEVFDRIVADKNNRAPILRDCISLNTERHFPARTFSR